MRIRDEDLSPKRVLTVRDVCGLTGFCPATVIRWFENEPGVIVLTRPEQMHKRKYRSIRIPRAVFERVRSRLTINR